MSISKIGRLKQPTNDNALNTWFSFTQ